MQHGIHSSRFAFSIYEICFAVGGEKVMHDEICLVFVVIESSLTIGRDVLIHSIYENSQSPNWCLIVPWLFRLDSNSKLVSIDFLLLCSFLYRGPGALTIEKGFCKKGSTPFRWIVFAMKSTIEIDLRMRSLQRSSWTNCQKTTWEWTWVLTLE